MIDDFDQRESDEVILTLKWWFFNKRWRKGIVGWPWLGGSGGDLLLSFWFCIS
jgi:hypothetical protein